MAHPRRRFVARWFHDCSGAVVSQRCKALPATRTFLVLPGRVALQKVLLRSYSDAAIAPPAVPVQQCARMHPAPLALIGTLLCPLSFFSSIASTDKYGSILASFVIHWFCGRTDAPVSARSCKF